MNCVRCGRETTVLSTRQDEFMLRRRRECCHCKHRFSSLEVDDGLLKTVKKYMAPHRAALAKRVALVQRNEKIITMLMAGEKHAVVAQQFGLSDNMVSTIARRNNVPSLRRLRSSR